MSFQGVGTTDIWLASISAGLRGYLFQRERAVPLCNAEFFPSM